MANLFDAVTEVGEFEVAPRRAANLDVALALAAAGIAIFPVKVYQDANGRWKKRPVVKGWQNAACCNPDQIRRWWTEFPEAVPGIELGQAGLVVIDADRHDADTDGVAAFDVLMAGHDGQGPHPKTSTAGGGEHHFYCQPPSMQLGNGEGRLPKGVNVRGAGGFVVAPGAVRPDGAIWKPAPGFPELTQAFRAGTVPVLPDWLLELIAPEQPTQAPTAPGGHRPAPQGRERAYAAKALRKSVDELARTSSGHRNNKLNAIAYRLGHMVARGWIEQETVITNLFAACQSNRLASDDGADSVRQTIESGLNAGLVRPHPDLPDIDKHKARDSNNGDSASPPLIPVLWDGDALPNPTQWLVRDLVPMGSAGLLVGESRAGKTFLAIDLARALSKGGLFVTKRARAGGTLYIAAEAPGTIPNRLRAARLGPLAPFLDEQGRDKTTGQEPNRLCVAVLAKPPGLLTDEGRGQLVATARDLSAKMLAKFGIPLRLIVIDTMLACFDITDWNDPSQTRRVMNALAKIAEETGAVVLGVHHHGKDVTRGAAGSYALTAAADFMISVLAETNTDGEVSSRRISVTKLRDGATGWGCEFDLVPFKVGVDDEGEDINSAFVEPKTVTAGFGQPAKSQKKKTPSSGLVAFNLAFEEALKESGEDRLVPPDGKSVRMVRVKDVRASFDRHHKPASTPANLADAQRQAFTRATKAILSEGKVRRETWDGTDWLWRDEEQNLGRLIA
jgi:hypothetical protein